MATADDFERLGRWAVIKNPDAGINRSKCERTVPMEVLSLGFPCTGTLAMQEALSILGYANPYHTSSLVENMQDMSWWISALRAKRKGRTPKNKEDFDQILGHCGAVTDIPCVCFWKELHEAYPDAKVVLVDINEDEWSSSCEILIDRIMKESVGRVALWLFDSTWFMLLLWSVSSSIKMLFGAESRSSIKANAKAAYRAHYFEIRTTISHNQLLEYQPSSGWEPLCAFLDKEVPSVPFPDRHDEATVHLVIKEVTRRARWNILGGIITSAILIGLNIGIDQLFRLVWHRN